MGRAPAPSGPVIGRLALVGGAMALALAACAGSVSTSPPAEPVLSIGRWGLEPTMLPGPNDRSISIGVWEVPCSGGRDISDKVLPPEVSYERSRVVVTIFLEPLPTLGPNEALTCPLAPPVPYELELSEPLGDRALLDGSTASGGDAMWGGLIDPGLIGPWQLVDGSLDGQAFAPMDASSVTFAIRGHVAGGDGGCNTYATDPLSVTPDAITIPGVISHLASCPGGRNVVEARFFEALRQVSTWRLAAGRLELSGDGAQLMFRRPTTAG